MNEPQQEAAAPAGQPAPPAAALAGPAEQPLERPPVAQQHGQQAPAKQQQDPSEHPKFPNDLLVYPYVPRTAIPAFAELCTAKAKAAVAAANHRDAADSLQHVFAFISTHSRTCSDLNGSRGAGRRVQAKLQQIVDGQLDQVPVQDTQHPAWLQSAEQQQARHIMCKLEAHQVRRAMSALDSGKLTEWSNDLPASAAALFPDLPPPQLPQSLQLLRQSPSRLKRL